MYQPKLAPNYILVQFNHEGKTYLYSSPFSHDKGDLVLVNTYGTLKVASVYAQSTDRYLLTDYSGPISSIQGLAYLLEDLHVPETQIQTRKTFLEWFRESLSK
jgi:hypothetical protein